MPQDEATFRGQLIMVRMQGRQTLLDICCLQGILYSVYAVLGVNLGSWHGDIVRDDVTLCSTMMVGLSMRKRDGG